MKKSKLAILASLALAAVLAVGLTACGGGSSSSNSASPAKSSENLRFVTGGESGTYYAFGSVIAQHATNNAGITVNALSGNGSQANVQALQDADAELAFCQSDVMAYAYNGTNLFEKSGAVKNFSVVAALYMESVQIVTCDPDIKTVADLRGKTVSVGAAGSGVFFNAMDILGAYDITIDDINPVYQSFGDSTDSLKDGKIDAAFIVAGAPTTAITDLSTSKTAYLVALDAEHIQKLLASSDYYKENTIPAGTYSGVTSDITTVAVAAVILADNSVSADAIYAFTADLFDSAPSQISAHAKYGEVSVEFGASMTSVPYHPGAAKYFGEKGITVTAAK